MHGTTARAPRKTDFPRVAKDEFMLALRGSVWADPPDRDQKRSWLPNKLNRGLGLREHYMIDAEKWQAEGVTLA